MPDGPSRLNSALIRPPPPPSCPLLSGGGAMLPRRLCSDSSGLEQLRSPSRSFGGVLLARICDAMLLKGVTIYISTRAEDSGLRPHLDGRAVRVAVPCGEAHGGAQAVGPRRPDVEVRACKHPRHANESAAIEKAFPWKYRDS